MANDGILTASYTESQVRVLYLGGSIRSVMVLAVAGKWRLLFVTDNLQVTLISEKSKKPRQFASLDTVAAWLRERMGGFRFTVDMTYWDALLS